MASYQNIETRLLVVEDKMDFLLRALPITLNLESKVVGIDGKPVHEIKRTNMLELYRLQKAGTGKTTMLPLAPPPPEPVSQPDGGID